MCQECRYTNCPPECPNYEYHKIGKCEKCGGNLYEECELWIDNDGHQFCSEDCAKEFNGIKEIDY